MRASALRRWTQVSGSLSTHLVATTGTNLGLALLGLLTGMLSARLLGPAGRGELAAIQTWPTNIATLAMLGLGEATVYFSAREPERAGRYLASATSLALLAALPFSTATYLLMPILLAAQSLQVVRAAQWYLLMIPIYAFVGMPCNALRGRNDLVVWNILRLTPNMGWLLVLVAASALGRPTPEWVAAGHLIMLGFLFCPVFGVVRRRLPGPFVPDRGLWRQMLSYGIPSAAGTASQMFNLRLDQMLMAALLPPRLLGLYVVAVAWGGAAAPATNAIGAVIFPRVASQNLASAQAKTLVQTIRLGSVAAAGLGTVLLLLTPWAIPMLFGTHYAPAIPAALILTVAGVIIGINTVLEEGVRGLGDTKAIFWSELSGLAITIVTLALLLRPLGIVGAAAASLLAYATVSISLLARIQRKTGYPVAKLLLPRGEDFLLAGQRLLAIVKG